MLTERDRRRGPHILVRMFVDHLLQLIGSKTDLVDKNMVVDGTRSTLDGGV